MRAGDPAPIVALMRQFWMAVLVLNPEYPDTVPEDPEPPLRIVWQGSILPQSSSLMPEIDRLNFQFTLIEVTVEPAGGDTGVT
jgi:hypothetical protein